MSAGGPAAAIHSRVHGPALGKPFDLSSLPPRLVAREASIEPVMRPRRAKIWEFSTHLHCSIIGTCLSTGELRQTLKKLGVVTQGASDHELHGVAVTLAGRHDDAARLLNKALDHRHKLAVSQFAKAATEDALRALWAESVRRGEIPGAYWATLTHPLANQTVIREAFGEVHMLSHLIGSANRADIRRLCQLEAEKAALALKLQRQQIALHEAVVTRDAQINELRQALTQRIVSEAADSAADDTAALRGLVSDLEKRLTGESRRRGVLEERLAAAQAALSRERAARACAERDRDAMREELDAIEATFGSPCCPAERPAMRLDGVTVLYVGGRPNQIAQLRGSAERLGASFLHHDGGVESHTSLLPGLANRADVVLFPVDCISHEAANAVKALCRQAAKRYIPLRSASITSLLAGLQAAALAGLRDAAD